jgi:hypothetical protein
MPELAAGIVADAAVSVGASRHCGNVGRVYFEGASRLVSLLSSRRVVLTLVTAVIAGGSIRWDLFDMSVSDSEGGSFTHIWTSVVTKSTVRNLISTSVSI